MIHKISRLLMTLVALFALTAGAWAETETISTAADLWQGAKTFTGTNVTVSVQDGGNLDGSYVSVTKTMDISVTGDNIITGLVLTIGLNSGQAAYMLAQPGNCTVSGSGSHSTFVTVTDINASSVTMVMDDYAVYVEKVEVTYANPYTPMPVAGQTNQWQFSMPGSNVVLTPIYAAATIYDTDGQTEKSAYASLKEAIQNVQNGETIKLEGDVTLADGNELSTADRATEDPVQFTLDFNGYTLDGLAVAGMCLTAAHEGDQITFTDSSEGQTGGLKGTVQGAPNSLVFDGGRYNFKGLTAAQIEDNWSGMFVPNGWELASGKEFVDIENSPDEKDFTLRVDYAAIELTIGPQKFVTFYLDQNVKLDEATSGVTVYTVTGIDTDRSLANVSPVSGVVAKETPILLYNATDNELTAKLTVTPDAANAVDVAPEFKGTAEAREFTATDMAAADYYALVGGKAFAPVYNPGTIGANKCWLEFAKQQTPGARQLTIVFDETTGINEVVEVNEAGDDTLYDLSGRKIQKPARKGVYIKNGQKKVVK